VTDFREIIQKSNFMKIHPMGVQLFHANGWTDRHDEANSRFSSFCESALKPHRFHLDNHAAYRGYVV